jgi:phosphopantothenoylcysteine decarboxylase / phosphopantothenate---cysteine ligase
VVGNDISGEGVGFGADDNEVYVVGREEERFVPRASKPEVARIILDAMMSEMERQR